MENEIRNNNAAGAEILEGEGKTVIVVPDTEKIQPVTAACTENFYKSFKTKDDFVRAYTSLEREFTRKSQEFSDFKKEKPFDAEGEAKRFLGVFPEAGEYAEEIASALEAAGEIAAGAMERAYLTVLKSKTEPRETFIHRAMTDGEIREKVVLDYLKNLPVNLPKLSSGGRTPASEPKRAKTLSEAGADALQILKR